MRPFRIHENIVFLEGGINLGNKEYLFMLEDRQRLDAVYFSVSTLLQEKDPVTFAHCTNFADFFQDFWTFCKYDINRMNFSANEEQATEVVTAIRKELEAIEIPTDVLRMIAFLHDCGKLQMPNGILKSPKKFGVETYHRQLFIEKHAENGVEFVGFLPETLLAIIRNHHENFNGEGYPSKLAGKSIPILCRLASPIDVFEALLAKRDYKDADPLTFVLRKLKKDSGIKFDPQIVGEAGRPGIFDMWLSDERPLVEKMIVTRYEYPFGKKS